MTGRLCIETSALLRCTLEGDQQLARRIDQADLLATSVVTLYESYRDLERRRSQGSTKARWPTPPGWRAAWMRTAT